MICNEMQCIAMQWIEEKKNGFAKKDTNYELECIGKCLHDDDDDKWLAAHELKQ